MTAPIRVAVTGYGVIGKRVADAVRAMPDMHLVGVADVATDWRIRTAAELGIPVFAAGESARHAMVSAGIPVLGTLEDLLGQVDVVVDATPKKVAAAALPLYRRAGVKVILQGGESHATTGHSFVAQANYASAVGRESTRVVSCNTTSIVRVLGALDAADLLASAGHTDPARHRSRRVPPGWGDEHDRSRVVHSLPSRTGRANRPAESRCGDHGRQGRAHPNPQPLLEPATAPTQQPR